MPKLTPIALAAFAGLMLAACSAEKEGEKLDTAIEEATTGETAHSDGLLEDAGEVIDEVTGAENDDPVDAVGDAVEDAADEVTDENPV